MTCGNIREVCLSLVIELSGLGCTVREADLVCLTGHGDAVFIHKNKTDLGCAVYGWRFGRFGGNELPILGIEIGEAQATSACGNVFKMSLSLVIELSGLGSTIGQADLVRLLGVGIALFIEKLEGNFRIAGWNGIAIGGTNGRCRDVVPIIPIEIG